VTGQAGSKPSLKPLNTAQCTSIIDAMKEGTPLLRSACVVCFPGGLTPYVICFV
jgi:hypothetical protein